MKTQNKQPLSEEERQDLLSNLPSIWVSSTGSIELGDDVEKFFEYIETLVEKKLEEQRENYKMLIETMFTGYDQKRHEIRLQATVTPGFLEDLFGITGYDPKQVLESKHKQD